MLLVSSSSTAYKAGYFYGAENDDLLITFVSELLLAWLGGIRLFDVFRLGCMIWDHFITMCM